MIKIIKESLNEKFTEESDPIDDLGIGIVNNLDDLLKLILKNDLKKMIFTIAVKTYLNKSEICIHFDANKAKGYFKNSKEAINYAEQILFEKLNLNKIFIRRSVQDEFIGDIGRIVIFYNINKKTNLEEFKYRRNPADDKKFIKLSIDQTFI